MSFLVDLLDAADEETCETLGQSLLASASYRAEAGDAIRLAVAKANGREIEFRVPRELPTELRLDALNAALESLPDEAIAGLLEACSHLAANGDGVAPHLERKLRFMMALRDERARSGSEEG